jgi:hypothetical protein
VLHFVLSAAVVVPSAYLPLWLIRRFGFVAMLAAWMGRSLITPFVFGSWYDARALVAQFILIAVAAWAFSVILSRQPSVESAM